MSQEQLLDSGSEDSNPEQLRREYASEDGDENRVQEDFNDNQNDEHALESKLDNLNINSERDIPPPISAFRKQMEQDRDKQADRRGGRGRNRGGGNGGGRRMRRDDRFRWRDDNVRRPPRRYVTDEDINYRRNFRESRPDRARRPYNRGGGTRNRSYSSKPVQTYRPKANAPKQPPSSFNDGRPNQSTPNMTNNNNNNNNFRPYENRNQFYRNDNGTAFDDGRNAISKKFSSTQKSFVSNRPAPSSSRRYSNRNQSGGHQAHLNTPDVPTDQISTTNASKRYSSQRVVTNDIYTPSSTYTVPYPASSVIPVSPEYMTYLPVQMQPYIPYPSSQYDYPPYYEHNGQVYYSLLPQIMQQQYRQQNAEAFEEDDRPEMIPDYMYQPYSAQYATNHNNRQTVDYNIPNPPHSSSYATNPKRTWKMKPTTQEFIPAGQRATKSTETQKTTNSSPPNPPAPSTKSDTVGTEKPESDTEKNNLQQKDSNET
eukprot:TRINITY_DN3104_c0_g1_i1.p1 TRINITY_DN3104_c0_g1~~TRINITY_DN3104_c0_g1_i1.p1  ORF type:complete len:484 (-),score=92.70 TRINITY_DN3104_c0_g1_i1:103-1554(-)